MLKLVQKNTDELDLPSRKDVGIFSLLNFFVYFTDGTVVEGIPFIL